MNKIKSLFPLFAMIIINMLYCILLLLFNWVFVLLLLIFNKKHFNEFNNDLYNRISKVDIIIEEANKSLKEEKE